MGIFTNVNTTQYSLPQLFTKYLIRDFYEILNTRLLRNIQFLIFTKC